jgi:hypothetical protein
MSETPDTVTPAFKNRRPGLIGCGVVHLLFGLLFVGFALLMVVAFLNMPAETAPAMPAGVMAYAGLFYLALAALFASLGIGSMMARRWAPPMILVTSWGWLVAGIAGICMMGVMGPMMTASIPENQPGAKTFMVGCMAVTFGVFGIIVPLIFVLFYRSPDVKATVEQLDPVPRWTDGQPVSLLVFASWMFFGALSVLLSSLMYKALPIGGFMLRGWPVFAILAAMATLLFWIGWGTLRRWRSAWWLAVVMLVVGIAWGTLLLTSTDPTAMSTAMGMAPDPKQAEMTAAMYSSPFFYGWMALFWVAYLAFLLYIRRYFFARSEPA